MKIYKYTHKQITTRSILLSLPAFLLVIAAVVWKFSGIDLARQYLELNLQLPAGIQLLVWIALPIWAVWKARRAFKYGTVKRYRKFNVLALIMGVIPLIAFAIIIGASFI